MSFSLTNKASFSRGFSFALEEIYKLMRDRSTGLPSELLEVRQIKSYLCNLARKDKKQPQHESEDENETVSDTLNIMSSMLNSLSDSESD